MSLLPASRGHAWPGMLGAVCVIAALPACAPSLYGDWQGTCESRDTTYDVFLHQVERPPSEADATVADSEGAFRIWLGDAEVATGGATRELVDLQGLQCVSADGCTIEGIDYGPDYVWLKADDGPGASLTLQGFVGFDDVMEGRCWLTGWASDEGIFHLERLPPGGE